LGHLVPEDPVAADSYSVTLVTLSDRLESLSDQQKSLSNELWNQHSTLKSLKWVITIVSAALFAAVGITATVLGISLSNLNSSLDSSMGMVESRMGGLESRMDNLFEIVARLREDFARLQVTVNGPVAYGTDRLRPLPSDDPAGVGIPDRRAPADSGPAEPHSR
jgi:hypothetical protein